ncbi:hypothetical protein GLOTRDRAFT_135903 [Gloeophyllum trabeum ATCC 11539]|uniref:PH-domain-containing protein n=1 Tax=Gloeophyllum trabeum (strain ATCC 11539 / FP-39264 / Madison 617) TaxID=670483 RepID=S7RZL0_GLOTA|nr:uncharacterized protein GLOTRDRAFT_135903 [Gloeophyllum trabeum ATCC 11539]EPQ58889.1 hypothetical protein GLOTRDRAFT_135903 [Gloeophyllum trabeum ATCC 11539]
MPEYVYALHDFAPEHDDEVPFRAGERIEVLEKDDLYGDGWWQGRNLAGQTGLFPQSYTTPAPPAASVSPPHSSAAPPAPAPATGSSSALQTLSEEPESTAASPPATTNGNHTRAASQGEEVMRATMTDVQQAIEQLGRSDRDGARSFSFASTREGDVTDRESESEAMLESDAEGENWHKDARQRLAEQARRANERAAAAEAAQLESLRASGPPIEAEMSDESEDEDEGSPDLRRHSHITEEDEEDTGPAIMAIIANSVAEEAPSMSSHELYLPPTDENEAQTATARRTSFPVIYPPIQASTSAENVAPPTPTSPMSSPLLIHKEPSTNRLSVESKTAQSSTTAIVSTSATMRDVTPGLPSPSASSIQMPQPQTIVVTSAPAMPPAQHAEPPELAPTSDELLKKPSSHPTDWTVEEVVEWLKSKGFDQTVCDKFIEQEITGDVLLELDANLLKSEIGIAAFGKRVRIANAIQELRRPPSIVYSDHQPSNIITQASPSQPSQGFSHSRSHSYSHSHSHSIQSSAQSVGRSPTTPATANTMSTAPESAGFSSMIGSDSGTGEFTLPSPDARQSTKEFLESRRESARSNLNATADQDQTKFGLGLAVPGEPNGAETNGKSAKNRPPQLTLSPSDGALAAKAASAEQLLEGRDEDRAAMSEGETAQASPTKAKKTARRMFGRSVDSSSPREKDKESLKSKEGASPMSATSKRESSKSDEQSVVSRHSKGKRSVDATKSTDRLSLFGGTFSGTLGKSRKPPPRYSSIVDNADLTSEKSGSGFSKIYGGGKKSSGRPSTADGSTPRQSFRDKPKSSPPKEGEKRPERLRKRTISSSDAVATAPRGLVGNQLKPGQSVLEQIGTPDHNGWMRKKGERYNTWKLRYFVLKGPHLYYMRSNSKTETKLKGYINIVGYRVVADENVDPGRYGFKIVHDTERSHFFSSDEQLVIREWMKALMKATIGRDYTKPVVSSCNVPTIPLTVAQAMNPAPRPPSPGARAATQKALRRENPNQLSSRDARILMGLPSAGGTENKEPDRARLDSVFADDASLSNGAEPHTPKAMSPKSPVPPRPSREMRRMSTPLSGGAGDIDQELVDWANSHLPQNLHITGSAGSLYGGLALLRLAESIKGKPSSPPVPDSAFPTNPSDDKLDGLFRLFDFLLDNDVKMGTVSINDIRQGKRDKVVQLLKALKAWEDKRKILAQSISNPVVPSGAFMAMGGPAGPGGLSWGYSA